MELPTPAEISMLVINGALAVLNGLLVATGKIWCECVLGGTCCGGESRCV